MLNCYLYCILLRSAVGQQGLSETLSYFPFFLILGKNFYQHTTMLLCGIKDFSYFEPEYSPSLGSGRKWAQSQLGVSKKGGLCVRPPLITKTLRSRSLLRLLRYIFSIHDNFIKFRLFIGQHSHCWS